MSQNVVGGYDTEKKLRRSKRQKKVRTPIVSQSSSGIETLGSEEETVPGRNLGEVESEVEGSIHSFGEFYNTAHEDYNFKDVIVEEKVVEMSKGSNDSGKGVTPEPGLGDFMRVYFEDHKRRDEESRREREFRDRQLAAKEEADRAREERLFLTLRERTPMPEPAERATIDLPRMKGSDNVEQFLLLFEMALKVNKVPEGLWRSKLISHIPLDMLMKVQAVMEDEDGTYQDAVEALMGTSSVTFCAASEDLMTGERGKVWDMEGRQAMARLKVLLNQVTRDADTKPQLLDCIAVAMARDRLVPGLKGYVDSSKRFQLGEFMGVCEPIKTSWFRKNKPYQIPPSKVQGGGNLFGSRKPVSSISCFTCGKQGHMSRKCRSCPQAEAATNPRAPAAPVAAEGAGGKTGEVVCFRGNGKGHKSPACPTKPKSNRRVRLPEREPVALSHEELFGAVGEYSMGITIDTGAQVSIVPKECVREEQMTGFKQKVRSFQGSLVEGDACNVQFTLGDRVFNREAVAVAGDLINWTPCFRMPLTPRSELDFLMELAEKKAEQKGEQLYVPLKVHNGILHTGYRVSERSEYSVDQEPSDSVAIVGTDKTVKLVEEEEQTVEKECADMMAIDMGKDDEDVVENNYDEADGDHGQVEEDGRVDDASVSAEAGGDASGGCAEQGEELLLEEIKGTRSKLVEETKSDETLHVARGLAERNKEGYRYQEGIVIRTRLNKRGKHK